LRASLCQQLDEIIWARLYKSVASIPISYARQAANGGADKCECGDGREEKSIKNASTALLAILSLLRLPLLRLP